MSLVLIFLSFGLFILGLALYGRLLWMAILLMAAGPLLLLATVYLHRTVASPPKTTVKAEKSAKYESVNLSKETFEKTHAKTADYGYEQGNKVAGETVQKLGNGISDLNRKVERLAEELKKPVRPNGASETQELLPSPLGMEIEDERNPVTVEQLGPGVLLCKFDFPRSGTVIHTGIFLGPSQACYLYTPSDIPGLQAGLYREVCGYSWDYAPSAKLSNSSNPHSVRNARGGIAELVFSAARVQKSGIHSIRVSGPVTVRYGEYAPGIPAGELY